MRNDNITRLTLAGMFAALAFVCFTYLRIEIPMGGGMTGKIYIGHAFILLSALIRTSAPDSLSICNQLCCFHGGKRCAICYFSSFPV